MPSSVFDVLRKTVSPSSTMDQVKKVGVVKELGWVASALPVRTGRLQPRTQRATTCTLAPVGFSNQHHHPSLFGRQINSSPHRLDAHSSVIFASIRVFDVWPSMTHLLQLSNELIDLIVANLERQDAFALRSCCRTLCDATWSHCAKTWFSKFIIYGFGNGVLRHAQVAAQPRVCRSIKHLCLILDPVEDLSSRSEFLCNTLRAHFSSMPNLVTLTVRRTKSDVHWKKRDWKWYRDHEKISEHILQVFINLLVTPNQLRTLEIKSSDFRGWSDGLLKLEALAVMARAAPLIQTNFASLVSLTISLNTSTDNDPDCRCALADFVKAIPTLEELTIAGSKRPRAPPPPMIFRALCMATLGDKKLPRLKRLRLRFFPIEFEPLMDFVLGHISTLTRFEMDHVLLLESRTPLDPIPRSTQVVSDWNFFMDDLDDFAFVHPCTWDLMWDRPERAQRIVLQLWEKTPVRLEKVRRAIEEGRDPPRFE